MVVFRAEHYERAKSVVEHLSGVTCYCRAAVTPAINCRMCVTVAMAALMTEAVGGTLNVNVVEPKETQ